MTKILKFAALALVLATTFTAGTVFGPAFFEGCGTLSSRIELKYYNTLHILKGEEPIYSKCGY